MKKVSRTVDYPHDLLDEILRTYYYSEKINRYSRSFIVDWNIIIKNFDANWEYLKKTLTPREERVIDAYYKEGLTLGEIAKEFDVTRARIQQIQSKAIRRLSLPTKVNMLIQNVEKLSERDSLKTEIEQEILYLQKELWKIKNTPEVFFEENKERLKIDIDIEELDLSVRSFNCLKRAGIYTVRDLIQKTEEELLKVRNLGRKSCKEVKTILNNNGYFLKGQEEKEK